MPKDFNKCIRDLYKQEESKTSSRLLKHHTSDYLTRVERIREETNQSISATPSSILRPAEKQQSEAAKANATSGFNDNNNMLQVTATLHEESESGTDRLLSAGKAVQSPAVVHHHKLDKKKAACPNGNYHLMSQNSPKNSTFRNSG